MGTNGARERKCERVILQMMMLSEMGLWSKEQKKKSLLLSSPSHSLYLHPPSILSSRSGLGAAGLPPWPRRVVVGGEGGGGNLIARRGQDSALSMVLRRLRPGCYHQIRQDKFQIDARDVSRPPAVGVKVLTSPPSLLLNRQVSTKTHTPDAAVSRVSGSALAR